MPRYTTVIASTWPVERAFTYMSNFANAREWDPGVVTATQLGADAIDVGTEFDLEVTFAGRRKAMRYRIEEYEPNRRVVFQSLTRLLRSVDSLTFDSSPEGCEMVYDADLRFLGLATVVNPLLAVFFRSTGDRARDSLRALLRN